VLENLWLMTKPIYLFLTLLIFFHPIAVEAQNSVRGFLYFSIAEEFKKDNKTDSAIIYYQKAGAIFKTDQQIEDFVNANNQAGVLLTRQDQYDKAKTFLNEALSAGQKFLSPDNLALSNTYLALGVVDAAEENFTRSLDYHYKALAIRLSKLGEYHSDVANSYGNIGNVYFRKKEFSKAIEAHHKALAIREKLFGPLGVELVQTYNNLGNAYRDNKEYETALTYFEKALNNKIRQGGASQKDLAKIYKSMSEVYYLMNNRLQGDVYKSKAAEL
jgi:tetratricopeptide (TPR) repeat protein